MRPRKSTFEKPSSEMIRYLVARRGLTLADIAETIGADEAFVSDVQDAKGELTTSHLQDLADRIGIDWCVMMAESGRFAREGSVLSPMNQAVADLCQASLLGHDIAEPAARIARLARPVAAAG